MSFGQTGRQIINPITGESRFPQLQQLQQQIQPQPQVQYHQPDIPKVSAESKRNNMYQSEVGQDRYAQLYDQVQNLEKQFNNEVKRNSRSIVELERQTPTQDYDSKIYSLETKYMNQERSRNELSQRVMLQDQNIKELMYLVKNFQNKDNNEILQMRGMLQEKITEEGANMQKEREKIKALFMEVVRQGEQQEKFQESLQALNQQYEQRMMSIESKLYNGEKALTQVAQKGDVGMNYINDSMDRMERRVMSLESNLLGLGKDQLKDHDQIARVDGAQQRLQEDLKSMLNAIQQDYQNRFDARSTELVNRIVIEHETRVKSMDEFKSTLQSKEQINQERQQYEREEQRERISSLEVMIRADSQKKEEAIRQLQTVVETQVNTIYVNLQNEEAQRYAHEVALRADLLKIQENIKQENEYFKSHQTSIIEKITEMIRIEVQNRLSSDVDLKNLTSAIASDIVSDLNSLKDQIDAQNRSMEQQMRNLERDSSDKAERLSIYIDDEVSKAAKQYSAKYDKVKQIFAKFAEQFKQHLVNNENNRQDTEGRLKVVEQNHEMVRNDFQTVLEELQEHLLNRIAEEKNFILQSTGETFQVVADKINKLDEEQNNKFKILKEAVEENHQLISDKIKLILEQNEAYYKETRSSMKLIVSAIQDVKDNVVAMQKEFKEQVDQIKLSISEIEQILEGINDKLAQINNSIEAIKEEQARLNDSIEVLQKDQDDLRLLVEDIQRANKIIEQEQQRIKEFQESIQKTMDTINENIIQMREQQDNMRQNFETQQGEIVKIVEAIGKLEQADDQISNQLSDEMKAQNDLHQRNKQQMTEIQDQMRNKNDEFLKLTLRVDDHQQSISHMQENMKTLVRLPN